MLPLPVVLLMVSTLPFPMGLVLVMGFEGGGDATVGVLSQNIPV